MEDHIIICLGFLKYYGEVEFILEEEKEYGVVCTIGHILRGINHDFALETLNVVGVSWFSRNPLLNTRDPPRFKFAFVNYEAV